MICLSTSRGSLFMVPPGLSNFAVVEVGSALLPEFPRGVMARPGGPVLFDGSKLKRASPRLIGRALRISRSATRPIRRIGYSTDRTQLNLRYDHHHHQPQQQGHYDKLERAACYALGAETA
jgi:hypothetical protein